MWTKVNENEFCTEASDLGLRPGVSPSDQAPAGIRHPRLPRWVTGRHDGEVTHWTTYAARDGQASPLVKLVIFND